MPNIFAFNDVNNELGDIICMVTNTLNGFGEEKQIKAGGDHAGIFHHVRNQFRAKNTNTN